MREIDQIDTSIECKSADDFLEYLRKCHARWITEQIIKYGAYPIKHPYDFDWLFSEAGSFDISFLTANRIDWNLTCTAQHTGIPARFLVRHINHE